MTVDPDGPLRDGSRITVRATGLPPFGVVSVAYCANGWAVLDPIPLDGLPCITLGELWRMLPPPTDPSGRSSFEASLARTLPYDDGPIDCGDQPGRCALLLVYHEVVVAKIEITIS